MINNKMKDVLNAAAATFKDRYRQVDIEEFFLEHQIMIADGTSKRAYAYNTLASLPQPQALELILEMALKQKSFFLQEQVYELQDEGVPQISEITRREIAKIMGYRLHGDGVDVDKLSNLFELESVVDQIGSVLSASLPLSLKQELQRNAVGKSPNWSAAEVFAKVGAFSCSSRRFAQLIESTLDPLLRDANSQSSLIEQLAPLLKIDHHEICESGTISGRKKYDVRPIRRGVEGRPKNLIFASIGPKPTLGFSDAIDNDMQVLANGESCLIYDRPIGDGLRWTELVTWWAEREGISDKKDARQKLGQRLHQSLASDPERIVFKTYFVSLYDKLKDRLPALIPQVYLHYDPEVLSRVVDRDSLFRQRMDFLLLLPGHQRVILEVDGKQHYANGDKASPELYSRMVAADRDLRLRGYEVYRFGGFELSQSNSGALVAEFFERLFEIHRIL